MEYGDYRSAREAGNDWPMIYEIAMSLDREDERAVAVSDWWRCADLREVARSLVWSGLEERGADSEHNALWWIDERTWRCKLGGYVIASDKTIDLQTLQKKWAAVPARSVLHIWEAWAAVHATEHFDAPRRAIEICEQGVVASIAVQGDGLAGYAAASWAAEAAAWAAVAAAMVEETDATVDAAWAAVDAAWAAAEAAAAAAWAEEAAVADAETAVEAARAASRAASRAAVRVRHGTEGAALEAGAWSGAYSEWSVEWAVHVLETIRISK